MIRRKHQSYEEETSYWLSYSDMMAALLLIFVLIISVTILEAQRKYEEDALELQQSQMELEEKQAQLEEKEETIKAQQEKIDQIIGVRAELIEALKEEFADSDLSVSVDDQTGAITFDSSVLFDSNEYELKSSGETFLNNFLPRYIRVLFSEEFYDYISQVIIEGHTDTDGGYIYNLELSQKRALEVAKYCLSEEEAVLTSDEINNLRSILTANGRSYSNPITNEDGTINKDASRRVEVMFRLKDDEMVREMQEILETE